MVRDYEMKFDKDDRKGSMPGWNLDTCEKNRGMVDDMIKDRREAKGEIKLTGGSGPMPMEVGQLRF